MIRVNIEEAERVALGLPYTALPPGAMRVADIVAAAALTAHALGAPLPDRDGAPGDGVHIECACDEGAA